MKRMFCLLSVFIFTACKGPKGDPGAPALGGTSHTLSGPITSPSPQTVIITGLDVSEGDFVSVYVCKPAGTTGTPCDQLSGDSSAPVHYEAIRAGIEITGAPVAGYTNYSITAVIRH